MSKKIIIAILIVLAVLFGGYLLNMVEEIEHTAAEAEEVAEDWIRSNAKTFTERGGSDLNHLETTELDEAVFEVEFEFESAFAGYGEEDDAEVITPHFIVVQVDSGEVVSVITDDVFDEINQEMIDEEESVSAVDLFYYYMEEEQEQLVSVEREIKPKNGIEEATLRALLEGVTEEEAEEMNYASTIDEDTELLSFSVEEGVATADFSEEIEPAGGSAWVTAVREQIEKTLLQFESIEEVVILVEGESEDILQP